MRIKYKFRKRISWEAVLMFLALFFVSSYALLEHASISIPMFSAVKFPLLYAGGVCVIPSINVMIRSYRKKKIFFVSLILLALYAMLFASSFINRDTAIGSSPMRSTVRLVLFMAELFALMIWAAEKGKGNFVIHFLFWYVLILVVATDLLMFTKLLVFRSGRFETYLVGNKFTVSYMHMNLLALWLLKNDGRFYFWQKSKLLAVLVAIWIIVASLYVDCITGLLGCIALICIMAMVRSSFQRKFLRLSSPNVLLLFLLVSVVFPFIAQAVVSIPFVQMLLESIFDRSNTLTGRLNIFEIFNKKMLDHWLLGYGYGNGNEISEMLFGYANAQNAVLYWVLQTGVLTTSLLIGLMLQVFRQLSRHEDKMKIMPMVALLYAYILMGAVETTFSMSFIMWIGLVFMYVCERKPIPSAETLQ